MLYANQLQLQLPLSSYFNFNFMQMPCFSIATNFILLFICVLILFACDIFYQRILRWWW